MNFSHFISGPIGAFHLAVSLVAMVTGMYVLVFPKGTRTHKRIGYLYAFSMLLLNISAFGLYNLFGGFGLFHWMALVSCATLTAGLYPVFTRKSKDYLVQHFTYMYWSVIGLYGAFMAETFVRLPRIVLTDTGRPNTIFYNMIGISVGLTMAAGVWFFIRYRPVWARQFANSQTNEGT